MDRSTLRVRPTRRQLLTGAAAALVALKLDGRSTQAFAKPPQRLLVNHLGFAVRASKYVLCAGAKPEWITIRRSDGGPKVVRKQSIVAPAELGAFTVLDLSDLREEGGYVASLDDGSSRQFRITTKPYDPAITAACDYFRQQRCGHPTIGHHAPCHLDDGRRSDNGVHHDCSGGWHDACDLRKWVDATIYGVIGLGQALETLGDAHPDRARALDEIRWGNTYFHKMQTPAGYLMRWCGGDQGNDYTDNIVGDGDDRVLEVEPAELPGQFQFVAAQALTGRLFAKSDGDYAARCIDAADRCLAWCEGRAPETCLSIAAGASAASQLFQTTQSERFAGSAARYGYAFLGFQASGNDGGWFRGRTDSPKPHREPQHGNLPLLALCDLLEALPKHADAPRWRDALAQHTTYLSKMADRSAFGIVHYGLYDGGDPGGGRKYGELWYRWFMQQRGETKDSEWWVGTNIHLASAGVGIHRAGVLLREPSLIARSQRHLDWILGVNPFSASQITGVGDNQPRLYRAGGFNPPTPPLLGGVINGIGGDKNDRPEVNPGSWQTCEYWTPAVAFVHWLLARCSIS